ncbi:uncharacterized protein LY89DRAFT_401351 [Mollisia scopiformis]|uniref:Uncharacterized protein n=1 Tax=Mollisia scopiformis TaxID=149040 RepID=A0A132B2K7_MOLSC|nr:uncharacterized protein LY89DRAFT_401351 [Mollisia scopiformis]KUJ06630.1 hypothetical protein LY89DRAFT_401351 [Mollisia scopiformis]
MGSTTFMMDFKDKERMGAKLGKSLFGNTPMIGKERNAKDRNRSFGSDYTRFYMYMPHPSILPYILGDLFWTFWRGFIDMEMTSKTYLYLFFLLLPPCCSLSVYHRRRRRCAKKRVLFRFADLFATPWQKLKNHTPTNRDLVYPWPMSSLRKRQRRRRVSCREAFRVGQSGFVPLREGRDGEVMVRWEGREGGKLVFVGEKRGWN